MTKRTWAQEALSRRTGRDIRELLYELYVEKRHTQAEIAEALGIDRVTVGQWIREYGISRDDRGPVVIEATA